METLLRDIQYGVRMLRKNAAFTLVAVLTLALGIGANSAIFSVVNGVLLSPLPFPHPEQLVRLHESKPNFDSGSISYPNFRDWQKENKTFSSLAISRGYAFTLTGSGKAERVNGLLISSELFRILGITPILGRDFAPGEDEIGGPSLVMIGEGIWKRRLGGASDILGKALTLDGRTYTIVGVIPASFEIQVDNLRNSDVYVPIGQWNNPLLPQRSAGLGIHGLGRLKPGITIDQARAELGHISNNLAAAYPDTNRGVGASMRYLTDEAVGSLRGVLLVLLGAVGFVLLIACVNIANLLLVRTAGRRREFAIRAAMGVGRTRIVRQLLTESILLCLLGGGFGLLLANWGTQAALTVVPVSLPRASAIEVDSHVLFFTIIVSLLAGTLSGLVPALQTAQSNLHDTLKESGRGLSGSRHRAQSVFSALEIAFALILLAGSGLMIRSMVRLWQVDPGFNPRNVWTFGVSQPPSLNTASPETVRASFRELLRRFSETPGITAVSLSWGASPLTWDDEWRFWLDQQPRPKDDKDLSWALDYVVSSDYLKVMQTPLLHGRFLTPHDDENAPRVAVVDDVFAKKFFPNGDAVGHRINVKDINQTMEIVGVVAHVKQWGLDSDDQSTVRAQMYTPVLQLPDEALGVGINVLARFQGLPTATLNELERSNASISSEQVLYGAQTMDEIVATSLAQQRFSMILLGTFAALALLLASVGVYGVMSFTVGQRTREIGIRLALGAGRSEILRLVLAGGGKLILIGVGLGFVAALGLMRFMAAQLYGVSAADPLTFAAVAALLSAVALLACYIPARRASRVNPLVALHQE